MKKLMVIAAALAIAFAFLPKAEAAENATLGLNVTFASTEVIPTGTPLGSVNVQDHKIGIGERDIVVPPTCIISWYDNSNGVYTIITLAQLADKLAQAQNNDTTVEVYNSPIHIVLTNSGWEISSTNICFRIVPDQVISIELNSTTWVLDGVGLGQKIQNRNMMTGAPLHRVTNTGNVTVEVEIGYGNCDGCQPDIRPGLDRFMTALGYMETDQPIIQPQGFIKMAHMLAPDKSADVGLTYYSPTVLSANIKTMNAIYMLRAYKSTN